ncbi:hypothetical protein ACFLXB_05045 [Chloroflexota bacterium]
MKKKWTKPELIILLRTHPEETSLTTDCKHPGLQGPGNIVAPPACADSKNNVPCHASNNKS